MEKIRNASQSLIVKICLGILALSFISWGATGGMSSMQPNEVIDVAGSPIYFTEVSQAYNSQKRQVQNALGETNLTPEIEQALGLPTNVLNNLISQKVLAKEAQSLDLRAAPVRLRDQIVSDSAFFDETNRFNAERYRTILSSMGYTVSSYENALRQEMLLVSLGGLFDLPDVANSLAEAHMGHAQEEITLSYLPLTEDTLTAPPAPTNAEISTYFTQNTDQFVTDERRSYTVLTLDANDLMATVNVPEMDARAFYDSDPAAFNAPEKRAVSHLVVSTESAAQALRSQLLAGKSFTTLAKQSSIDAFTKNNGGLIGTVSSDELPTEIAAVAFAMQPSAISEPVKSVLGWHLVTVSDITPAHPQTFDMVQAEITEALKQEQAEDLYYSLLEQIDSQIAAGDSLNAIATALNLSLTTAESVAYQPGDLVNNTAFTLTQNEISLPQDVANQTAVRYLQVTAIAPSRTQTLAEATSEITATLTADAWQRRIRETADDLEQQLAEGAGFAELARSSGIQTRTITNLTRSGSNSPAWLQRFHLPALFNLAAGEALPYAITTDGGLAFVQLNRRAQASWNESQQQQFKASFNSNLQGELFNQFTNQLVNKTKVEMNIPVLRQIFGDTFNGWGGE